MWLVLFKYGFAVVVFLVLLIIAACMTMSGRISNKIRDNEDYEPCENFPEALHEHLP